MAQMPKFLEDYVTVDELISKMNKEYPECRLVSELVGYGDDWVIFKSSFFENKDDLEPKATAYAKQTSKDHNSWFEMANTKANGRCLRIVFSESTLAEEMIGIVPSKNEAPTAPKKTNLEAKIEMLEAEGLVEDISNRSQAVMGNLKDFALSVTAQNLDEARKITAEALGQLGIASKDVDINNLQSIKNKIQDLATLSVMNKDGGE
jgi:hypothetical protein